MSGQGERQGVDAVQRRRLQRLVAGRQRDVDARGGEFAGREAAPQQLEAAHRFGVVGQALEPVVVGAEGEQAGDEHAEGQGRAGERRAGASQHDGADAPVDAAPPVGRGGGLGVEARLHRPVGAAADDRQDGRDQGERGEHHQRHGQRDDRPERLVGAQAGEAERGGGDEDGRAGGGDGAADAAHRAAHRLVAVAVAGQLLAEARRDEEHVVGAGAEQHDGHDAGRLAGDGQVELLGDPGADPAGQLEDEPDAQQRDHGDDRRSVDGEQQREDERDGHEQEDGVDLGEDAHEVDDQAAGPADGDLDAGEVERGRAVADGVDGVDEGRLGGLARDVGEDVERRAVGRDEGRAGVAGVGRAHLDDVVRGAGAGQPAGEAGRGGEAGRAEAAGLADDDEHGRAGRRESLPRELVGAGRFGVGGEEERGLVLAHVAEARQLRDQQPRDDQPNDQRGPLAARTAREVGDATKHKGLPASR